MYEVELKARLKDVAGLRARVEQLADDLSTKTYEDVYFNDLRDLQSEEKELRVRRIKSADSSTAVLTYKDAPFDEATKSKSEIEIDVSDQQGMIDILLNLGFFIDIRFKKICTLAHFIWEDYTIALTIAHVPELDATFLEIETLVSKERDTPKAFTALHTLLPHLHIPRSDLTTEYYTDAVRTCRQTHSKASKILASEQ